MTVSSSVVNCHLTPYYICFWQHTRVGANTAAFPSQVYDSFQYTDVPMPRVQSLQCQASLHVWVFNISRVCWKAGMLLCGNVWYKATTECVFRLSWQEGPFWRPDI